MSSAEKQAGKKGDKMKRYQQKEYGGKWDKKQGGQQKSRKKKGTYYGQTTYPWKNQQKTIRST